MARVCILFFTLILCACGQEKVPEGVVATVNGEPIYLHTLQTVMDTRSTSFGLSAQPSPEQMRQNYINALSALIMQTLMRQELKSYGLGLDQQAYNELMTEIGLDYDGKEREFLADAFIREDDWTELTQDYLLMDIFKKRVLAPHIVIPKQEIVDYYTSHREAFEIPELYQVCHLEGETESAIKELCAVAQKGGAEELSCQEMPLANIPGNMQQEIKAMSKPGCATPIQMDGMWQNLFYKGKKPAATISIIQAYPLIEKTLLERREQEAFDRWLEDKLKTASIMVAPELNESLKLITQEH